MGSSPDAVAPFHTKVQQDNTTDLAIILLPTNSSFFQAYMISRTRAAGSQAAKNMTVCWQVAAGLTTGALGILIASPTDLVKVRMQSESSGGAKRYPNARAAYGMIVRWVH